MTLFHADIVSVDQFDRKTLEMLFELADRCLPVARGEARSEVLRGRVLANLFFEPSTRTRLSFGTAFLRLGGALETTVGMQFSSMAKGETLEDTIRVIDGYADVLVLRHPEKGSASRAAEVAEHPLINGGDGPGEHPTQALLDAYTLRRELGRVDGLKVALVGDLRYGRTVHSLARLLTCFDGVELVFSSPPELSMPSEVTRILDQHGLPWSAAPSLHEALEVADVAYITRIQAERFEDPAEAARLVGQFVVNRKLLQDVDRLDLTMLHPLPRHGDLSADLDDLQGAAWFRQSHYGVPVRMALFCAIFGEEPTIV